jgi:hypothetical protein
MPQAHFPRSPLQIGDMDFVDSGLLGQVNLSPAALLAKLADAFSELDADIKGHSSSIDLVDALYLVDTLSGVVFLAQEPGSLPRRAGSVTLVKLLRIAGDFVLLNQWVCFSETNRSGKSHDRL